MPEPGATPIPFTVIGGFLGAGKTTLLNRLLVAPHGRRFAVLVNDFGSVDIDGRLIVAHGGDTIALANGCLCCSIGDSLATTLLDLLERPDRFDHVVVEASGVADPGRIADIGGIEPRLSRDGVIVVVDAADVRARAADRYVGDTVLRQIAAADLLVLNKRDLVEDAEATTLKTWLEGIAGAVAVVEARHADVPLAALFGLPPGADLHPAAPACEPAFRTWTFATPHPLSREGLVAVLDALPSPVLRAKGFVRFADSPGRRALLQRVGRRSRLDDEGAWGLGRLVSEIVVIGTPDMPSDADLAARFETAARPVVDAAVLSATLDRTR